MANIKWCAKNVLRFREPSESLAEDYLNSAKETIDILKLIRGKSKIWEATCKYYCQYFAFYALLSRLGIVSKKHECTIAVLRFLAKINVLNPKEPKQLEKDKKLREDNQYYLKNINISIDYNNLFQTILEIDNICKNIQDKEIMHIREQLKKVM